MKTYYTNQIKKQKGFFNMLFAPEYFEFIQKTFLDGVSQYLKNQPVTFWAPYLDLTASKAGEDISDITKAYIKTIVPSIQFGSYNRVITGTTTKSEVESMMVNSGLSFTNLFASLDVARKVDYSSPYRGFNWHLRNMRNSIYDFRTTNRSNNNNYIENTVCNHLLNYAVSLMHLQIKSEWSGYIKNAAATLTPEQIKQYGIRPSDESKRNEYDRILPHFEKNMKDLMKEMLILESILSVGKTANKKTLANIKRDLNTVRYYAGRLTKINY